MDTRGQYNETNVRHRRIIRLIALGLSQADVMSQVGVSLNTYKRVKYSATGKAALMVMLKDIDEREIELHSAAVVMRVST